VFPAGPGVHRDADAQAVLTQTGPQLVGASIELRGVAREHEAITRRPANMAIDMIRRTSHRHADAAVQDFDANAAAYPRYQRVAKRR